MKRIKNKRKLKIKIKHFDETLYTIDKAQSEKFKSDLARKGINESNYLFISINCPKRIGITNKKKQFDYLDDLLKSLTIFYVACFEWSDERSDGYHLHIIVSEEEFNIELIPDELLVDDLYHQSEFLANNCLDKCLGYVCKERKGCTASNRKEKFYFTNIPERKLIPIAVRSIMTEKTTEETIILEKVEDQVFKERIKAKNPKGILKSFFEKFLKVVKRFFPTLFINKKTVFTDGNQSYNICQNTRDGPFGWRKTKEDRWSC